MNLHEIGSLIVVDSGKPVGIVTERDMLSRVLTKPRVKTDTKVVDMMSKPIVTASPDMLAGDAAKLMIERNIKKLPVVENGKLMGLVSLTDLLRSKGVVEFLNRVSLEGVPLHMRQALNLYIDSGKEIKRRCPLITEQDFHVGCLQAKCMWWAGDICAVTRLSLQFPLGQMLETATET
jgi:CBS-domain-containing membrane protein